MADEGITDQDQQTPDNSQEIVKVRSQMQQLQEQLAQMNESYQANMQSVVDAVTKSQTQIDNSADEYLTTEEKQIKALRAEIEELKSSTPKMTQDILKRERDLNNTVVRLANDYPEIQSDPKMQQAVLDEHNKLPKSLRETAEGYELSVQRAVGKAGLVPKARRQNPSADADAFSSPGSGRSGSASAGAGKKKVKVSEGTLMWAELLGRDINDEKVLKGLEEATNRPYNRFK